MSHKLFELCQIRGFLAVSLPPAWRAQLKHGFTVVFCTRAEPFGSAIVFSHASFQHRQARAFLAPPVLVLFALAGTLAPWYAMLEVQMSLCLSPWFSSSVKGSVAAESELRCIFCAGTAPPSTARRKARNGETRHAPRSWMVSARVAMEG